MKKLSPLVRREFGKAKTLPVGLLFQNIKYVYCEVSDIRKGGRCPKGRGVSGRGANPQKFFMNKNLSQFLQLLSNEGEFERVLQNSTKLPNTL